MEKKKVKIEEGCDLNKQSAGVTSSSSISDESCSFGFKSPGAWSVAETTSPSYRYDWFVGFGNLDHVSLYLVCEFI